MIPLGKKCILEQIKEEKITESGIHLIGRGAYCEGVLIAKGKEVCEELQIGQKVLYEPGSAMPVGGGNRLLVQEQNIVAICSQTSDH